MLISDSILYNYALRGTGEGEGEDISLAFIYASDQI